MRVFRKQEQFDFEGTAPVSDQLPIRAGVSLERQLGIRLEVRAQPRHEIVPDPAMQLHDEVRVLR